MRALKGGNGAAEATSVDLLDAVSLVALSLGDVRGGEPSQPKLPQELGDPAPGPFLHDVLLGSL